MKGFLLYIFFLIFVGCTAGGEQEFFPSDPTTIEEDEEANFEPVIDSISVTPGNYISSQVITFTLTTPKQAILSGSLRIPFDLGGTTYYANYVNSSDAYTHLFTFTVSNSLSDLDGITLISPIELNGGSFKDIINNDFFLNFTIPDTTSVRVDSLNPSLLSVSKPADGLYIVGQQLNFTATFDEAVVISGNPRIPIALNSGSAYANYLSGSGTNTITFQMTVNPGNDDNDGIIVNSSIDLNGGSVQDSFGNNSSLTFTPLITTGITTQPFGAPVKLAFTQQPSTPNTRDVDFATQPIVEVQDAWNGTILNATDSITLLPFTDSSCTTPAGGTLNSNNQAALGGIATFSGVDYNSLGTIYIRASAPGLTSACSNATLVQLLPPTQVVFATYPGAAATAGIDFPTQPVVEVRDVTNSVVITASNSVTIAAFTNNTCTVPATGILSSTTQGSVAGIATFSGMDYTRAETIYLRASSAGLTSDCEAVGINVSPGADNKLSFTTYPGAAAIAGVDFATQPVVQVLDAYDNLTTSTATVSLNAYTNSTCTTTATGTLNNNSIAAISGTATFGGVDYEKAETIYLRASSGGLSVDCEPVAINVSTAPANKVIFTSYPGAAASAGTNFPVQPVVEIRDAFDNVINSTATINLNAFTNSTCTIAAGGSLASNSLAATAGVASFSGVNYDTVETIYLRASSTGLTSDCEPVGIAVSPAAPSKVVFTSYPGAGATAGIDFTTQPVVEVRDALDNLVNTATDTITLNAYTDSTCLTPATGTLNSGSAAAVAGAATFSGVDYTKAETIYLQASAVGLSSDCEPVAINVSPAAATKVTFATYPGAAATAGADFAVQPIVEIRDNFDNVVNSTATVNLNAFTNSTCSAGATGTLNSASLAAVSGTATFSGVDYTKAETIYLEASSTGLTSDCEAVAINVATAPAAKVVFTTYPGAAATAGTDFAIQPIVEIRDNFDNLVNSAATVNLNVFTNSTCSSAGTGTLNSAATAAVSGTATFSGVDYTKAETIYLRASSTGLTSDCEAVAINVATAPAAKVVFTTYPGAATAGTDFAIQPIVEVRDNFDNLVNSTATVNLNAFTNSTCSSAGTGTLNGAATAAVSGTATFSGVDYTKAETIYLRASSAGLTSDCEAVAITVSPGLATQVIFTTYPGAAASAGTNFPIQPVVEIRDALNNVVSSAATINLNAFTNSTCTVAGGGSLASNSLAATAGVASFSGVNYDTVETIYLRASSTGLTSDCEPVGITVSPATPSKVTFISYPGAAATAGADFAVQPVVEVRDGLDNLVTTATNTITLNAFTDSTCLTPATGTLNSNSIAAVTGTATFTTTDYTKAETIYLRASATGLTSDCEAVAINVSTAAASKVVFTTYPGGTATAGIDFAVQPVVEIRDNFDNLINSTATVGLNAFTNSTCSSAGTGTLNSNSVAAVSGTATFSGVDYTRAETIYLEASSAGLTSDCEPVGITISPAAASKVTFATYPGAAASAGTNFAIQPVVEIRDPFDNVVNSSATINLNAFTNSTCSSAGTGTLNSNSMAAVSGTANFSGVDYTKAEAIYLEASSAGLTSDCEATAITVSPGTATKVIFTSYPGAAATEDVDFPTQPVVEIRDALENVVSSTATVSINAFTNSVCSVAAGGTLNSNSIAAVAGTATFTGMDYTDPGTIYLRAASTGLTSDCEAVAIVVADVTPPANPTGLGISANWVTGATPNSPTLSWANPGDPDFNNAEAALGTSVGATDTVSYETTDNATNHVFDSLSLTECSVTYYSSVRALDTSSNPSSGTNMATGFRYDNTNPPAPGITTTWADSTATTSATIQWNAATDNCVLDHYEMAVSTSMDESGIIAGGAWTDLGNVTTGVLSGLTLTLGQTYYSLLKSVDEAGLESTFTVSSVWTYVLPPDSITDLATAEVKQDSVELSWSAPPDNGTPITDYVVEYRLSPAGSWTIFPDGVNTDTNLTVTGLTDDTTYDFRVKAINGSGASFSNIVTESTLINHPFFDPTAYKALNLGGATNSQIVALENTTTVLLNGAPLTVLTNKGDTFGFTSTLNDVVEADKPFFVAGRLGTGGNVNKGNITWNIPAWAGKEFLFNGSRDAEHVYTIYAFEATNITIYRGGVLQATQSVGADSNHTFRFATNGTYHVFSTGFITGYVYSEGGANDRVVDPYPVLPVSKDMIGFPSNRAQFGSVSNGNTYTRYHSDSNSGTAGTFNTGGFTQINPTGATTTLYRSNALRVIANDFITARSNADANGNCSAAFLPVSMQRKRYGLNVEAEWVAFASDQPGTITVYPPGGGSSTLNLTRTGTDPKAPYRVRIGVTAAGHVFESDVRMGAWYEPRTDTNGANDDETIMFGFD